jgi:ABC-type transport system involved in multi-copper enzyme maturation permease subunit
MSKRPEGFFRLVIWELEEYLSFPLLEFLIFVTIFLVLSPHISSWEFVDRYQDLKRPATNLITLFLVFIVGAVFSRSFAGSFAKGEVKMLLSYPVKRWKLFLAKFSALFLSLFALFSVILAFNLPLLALSPLEPMFYVTLLGVLLQLMFVCSITVTISLIVKKEVIAALFSIVLLFGIDVTCGDVSYLSSSGRFDIIFNYLNPYVFTGTIFSEFVNAVAFPLVVSAVLFALSFVYFTYVMQID